MKPPIRVFVISLCLVAAAGCSKGAPPPRTDASSSSGVAVGVYEKFGSAGTASPSPKAGQASGKPVAALPSDHPDLEKAKNKSAVGLPPNLPTYAKGTVHAPLKVTMSACVVQNGVQQVKIESAPGLQVSWATMWADGQAHKEWAGFGLGVIPPNGVYVTTFTVPAFAPLGDTRTDIAVAGKIDGKDATGFDHVYWLVKKSC